MEVQKTIDVIYKDDDLVAFYKPKNLPTVPLKGQECETLLSLGAKAFPEILSPYGKNPWEGTILHRLDTPTSGIVLAARNIPSVKLLLPSNLNVKDIVDADTIIATEAAINTITERLAK